MSRLLVLVIVLGIGWFATDPSAVAQTGGRALPPDSNALQSLRGNFSVWNFDGEEAGMPPKGFSAATLGNAPTGAWRIETDSQAVSQPHLLRQVARCPEADCFQVLLAEGTKLEYPDFSVRLRASPESSGSAGVIINARGSRDFYAVLVDLKSRSLEVLRVVEGKATVLGRGQIKPRQDRWHLLRVQRNTILSKEFIETAFDNKLVVSVEDKALGAGQIGLVTRGQGVFEFDNAGAMPLYSQKPHSPPAAY
jgi:hypothetical protein